MTLKNILPSPGFFPRISFPVHIGQLQKSCHYYLNNEDFLNSSRIFIKIVGMIAWIAPWTV